MLNWSAFLLHEQGKPLCVCVSLAGCELEKVCVILLHQPPVWVLYAGQLDIVDVSCSQPARAEELGTEGQHRHHRASC